MAIRRILIYPDRPLRLRARPVDEVDDSIRRLLDDLAETMYAVPGIGLAANQVGVPLRVFVIDIQSPKGGELIEFVNPRLVATSDPVMWKEGCLSLPNVTEEIDRYRKASVEALDREGKPIRVDATDLLAVAMQHEMDHIDGKLLLDRLSYFRKRLVQRQLARERAAGPQEPAAAPAARDNL